MAAQIREVEHSRQELVRSVLEVGVPRRSQSSIQIHLIPGSPRSSISPTSSSRTHGLHASSVRLEFPYLSARGQALSVAKWAELGGEKRKFAKWVVPYVSMLICFLLEGGSMA